MYQGGFQCLSAPFNLVMRHSFMPVVNIFRGSARLSTDQDADLTKLEFNRKQSYEADNYTTPGQL